MGATPARANTALADWCFNINGDTSTFCNGAGSGASFINSSGFDTTASPASNALGSVTITLGAGAGQFALAYMDYDLNFASEGSFTDSGSVQGSPPAGVTYELDDPNTSSIFSDMASNALTNANNVGTPSGPPAVCCDVAWALGVGDINVSAGQEALVTFLVSSSAPASGFYLQQTNSIDSETIYLSESVTTETTASATSTPEPASLLLVGSGLTGLGVARRRSRKAA
jgi:hypothetical protein